MQSNQALPFAITHESATIVLDGNPQTFTVGTIQYRAITDALRTQDWANVRQSLTVGGSLRQLLRGVYSVTDEGVICHEAEPLPWSIQARIRDLVALGQSIDPVLRFYDRLAKNPSHRSVTQLFEFLQHAGIPLQADGTFLAYKGVKEDFTDCHTGTVDNKPGVINRLPRNKISDDPQTPCHFGYHVGALSYAQNFCGNAGHVVICEVDPEYVVCVPHDESQRKMRVCEYKVIGHYAGAPLSSTVHDNDDEDEDDDEDENEDENEDEGDAPLGHDENLNTDSPFTNDELDKGYARLEAIIKTATKLPARPQPKAKAKRPNLINMDAAGLMAQSIGDLRKHAAGTLKIIGASKLPGGKRALVSKIMRIRRKG